MSRKSLEDALARHEEKLERRRLEHDEIRRGRERKKCADEQRERDLALQKRSLSAEIFGWAEAFAQTPLYHRLLAFRGSEYEGVREAYVFGGNWGHDNTYDDGFGCWSRMLLRADGTFRYFAGYKYMPVGQSILIANADEMCRKLCHEYLERFSDDIRTEEIYGRIREWHFRDDT